MCTACVFPKGTGLTEEEFDNCWDSNQDGGGFVYIGTDGQLVLKRSLELDELKKMWKEHHALHGEYSPFLLHFRASSIGAITEDNCHPFLPNPKVAMIHNGTIYKVDNSKTDKSDTRIFAEDKLSQLPHNFMKNKFIIDMMEHYLGTSNKVAFLNNNGETLLLNQSGWTEHNNAMFSNVFFRNKRSKVEKVSNPTGTGVGNVPVGSQTNGSNMGRVVNPLPSTSYTPHGGYYNGNKCQGCLFSVDKTSSTWDFSKNVCKECAGYIQEISKALKVDDHVAKDIFLAAARSHSETDYYSGRAGLDDEIIGNVPTEEEDEDDDDDQSYHGMSSLWIPTSDKVKEELSEDIWLTETARDHIGHLSDDEQLRAAILFSVPFHELTEEQFNWLTTRSLI